MDIQEILALKRIAYNNKKKDVQTEEDFIESVSKWWLKKYKMPKTDPRYLNMYIEDIIIEYFEEVFDDREELMAYEKGFSSVEECEEDQLKEIMGDDYTSEIAYLEKPTEKEKNHSIEDNVENSVENFEEIMEEFD